MSINQQNNLNYIVVIVLTGCRKNVSRAWTENGSREPAALRWLLRKVPAFFSMQLPVWCSLSYPQTACNVPNICIFCRKHIHADRCSYYELLIRYHGVHDFLYRGFYPFWIYGSQEFKNL